MTKTRTPERQIEDVKQQLIRLGDLRPGSLSKQYNVCGNPRCRCKEDPSQRHGPYYQISFTRKGRSSTKFVKKEAVSTVKKQLKNYATMKVLVDRWIELSTELCRIKVEQIKPGPEG